MSEAWCGFERDLLAIGVHGAECLLKIDQVLVADVAHASDITRLVSSVVVEHIRQVTQSEVRAALMKAVVTYKVIELLKRESGPAKGEGTLIDV